MQDKLYCLFSSSSKQEDGGDHLIRLPLIKVLSITCRVVVLQDVREIGIVLSMLVFIVKSNEFLNFLVVIMISVQILFEVFNADSHQKKKQAKSKASQ